MREITVQIDSGPSILHVDDDRPRTPVHGPGEALEAHLRMLAWLQTIHAPSMFYDLYKSSAGVKIEGPSYIDRAVAVQMPIFTATLDVAETIYVSPEMTRLTEALAEEYGERNPILHLTDVPVEAGLIVLGGEGLTLPYLGPSMPGEDLLEFSRSRAILFRLVAKGGVSLRIEDTNYVLEPEKDESPMSRLKDEGGIIMWDLYDGGQYLIGPGAFEDRGRPPFIPTRTTGYAFNVEEPWDDEFSAPRVRRFVATLLRLMWQRILSPEEWRPPRSLARRAHRAKRMPEDGSAIKVTHLRRYEPGWETEPSEAPGERGPMHYTVVVKGHWRDQYFPSLGPARTAEGDWNEASHRRIWIDPHLRGQGPLVLKHSLTAVVR